MFGEDFEGQDLGYVPENLEFVKNHSEEHDGGDVIDDSGFPQLQPDEHIASLAEHINPPENTYDVDGHDIENLPGNVDAPQLEHIEEQHDVGGVTENFASPEMQGAGEDSKGIEIKKWPGWPGENVFRILVPVQKVGSIIDHKGEFIKKITEETKARIKILDGPPRTSERASNRMKKTCSWLP